MFPDAILRRDPIAAARRSPRRGTRDRRFEILYLQSFAQMRSRVSKR